MRLIRAVLLAASMLIPIAHLTGCKPGVAVHGTVRDMAGETLPGVAVSADGGDVTALTAPSGMYTLHVQEGRTKLHFVKTGYTPGVLDVDTPGGSTNVSDVRLWSLPPTEGLYLLEGLRYRELDHPKARHYRVENEGVAFGTPVQPKITASAGFGGPDETAGVPRLVAHKLPAYDARLTKLRLVNAASQQVAIAPKSGESGAGDAIFTEKVFVADKQEIPLTEKPIDEPDRLLIQLVPALPLDPGVYAVHWGALNGLPGLEQRLFLFKVPDPAVPSAGEEKPEKPSAPEDKKRDEEREKRQEERKKETNKQTNGGMG